MNLGFNSSVSGLYASSAKLYASAQNIVNAQNTTALPDRPADYKGYVPQDAVSTSLETGGVQTSYVDRNPAYVATASLEDLQGVQASPNVDLAAEIINMQVAQTTYKANIKAIQTQDEMTKTLLDI